MHNKVLKLEIGTKTVISVNKANRINLLQAKPLSANTDQIKGLEDCRQGLPNKKWFMHSEQEDLRLSKGETELQSKTVRGSIVTKLNANWVTMIQQHPSQELSFLVCHQHPSNLLSQS